MAGKRMLQDTPASVTAFLLKHAVRNSYSSVATKTKSGISVINMLAETDPTLAWKIQLLWILPHPKEKLKRPEYLKYMRKGHTGMFLHL